MEVLSAAPFCLDEKHAIAVLYYLVADADFNITERESDLIDKKISNLLSDEILDEYEKQELLSKIINYSIGLSDEMKKETIKYLSQRVKFSHEQYIKLIQDLDEIARCDRNISIEAHSLMFFIRLKFKRNYARAEQYDIEIPTKVVSLNENTINIDGLAA